MQGEAFANPEGVESTCRAIANDIARRYMGLGLFQTLPYVKVIVSLDIGYNTLVYYTTEEIVKCVDAPWREKDVEEIWKGLNSVEGCYT